VEGNTILKEKLRQRNRLKRITVDGFLLRRVDRYYCIRVYLKTPDDELLRFIQRKASSYKKQRDE